MKVLVDGKVYDSAVTPIMVWFEGGEATSFKKSDSASDIFTCWPNSWNKQRGMKWRDANQALLEKSVSKHPLIMIDNSKIVDEQNTGS